MTAPDELRSDDDLVAEQLAFYRADASNSDRWLSTSSTSATAMR